MWDSIARDFPVTWKPRKAPLETTALAGYGVTKYIILERLRRRTQQELDGLKIVSIDDYFVLFGEKSRLPWGSGGVYLGSDPASPNLLMPVTLEPALPTHLFEHVLRSRLTPEMIGNNSPQNIPLAVLPQPFMVFAAVDARPVLDPEVLGRLPVRRLVSPALTTA